MYVLIFEDGSIRKTKEISQHETGAVESGYLDIVDISDKEDPLFYVDEGWTSIEDI